MSLIGYAYIGVGLETSGSAADVSRFLALFAGLFLIYFVAVTASHRQRSTASGAIAWQILMWAALFRLAMLPAGLPPATWWQDLGSDLRSQEISYRSFLLYDNDVWRYLWDGHVFAAGLDPYAWSPADLEARADADDPAALRLFEDQLWYDVFDRVTYETYNTVYPPAAQWLFRSVHWLAPASVFVFKLALVVFDFATCLLLRTLLLRRGGRPELVVIYAWNPLVLKEIAGSGHVDALMIFFLVLAAFCLIERRRLTGLLAFALAISAKLTPILLLGLYLRRTRARDWWVLGAGLGVAYLPFVGSLETMFHSLRRFSSEWVFNPGPWLLIHSLAEAGSGGDGRTAATAATLAVTLGLLAWATLGDDGSSTHLISGSFWILAGFLLFSAAVMPWYLLWVLPFAALRAAEVERLSERPEVLAWTALTATSLLSYLIYIDQTEHVWWLWVEYLGFFTVWLSGLWYQRTAPRQPRLLG